MWQAIRLLAFEDDMQEKRSGASVCSVSFVPVETVTSRGASKKSHVAREQKGGGEREME